MSWSIRDVESGFYAFRLPTQTKGLIETPLHIFREVSSTHRRLALNLLLDSIDICGEVRDIESLIWLAIVSVRNKGDTHGQPLVLILHMIDNLMQGVLRSLDPGLHRGRAVQDQAKIQGL